VLVLGQGALLSLSPSQQLQQRLHHLARPQCLLLLLVVVVGAEPLRVQDTSPSLSPRWQQQQQQQQQQRLRPPPHPQGLLPLPLILNTNQHHRPRPSPQSQRLLLLVHSLLVLVLHGAHGDLPHQMQADS
jgi:hypothetical protein